MFVGYNVGNKSKFFIMISRRNMLKKGGAAIAAGLGGSGVMSVFAQQKSASKTVAGMKDLVGDDILIGAAIPKAEMPADKKALLIREFNSITPENCMKWTHIHRNGAFRFEPVDALVKLALENKMKVIGHVLVFNREGNYPMWIFKDGEKEASKELIWKRIRSYMEEVMGRYEGKIMAWDVLNEFVEPHEPFYRKTTLTEQLEADYPVKLFKLAEEISPKSQLIYNDYGIENPKRRKFIFDFVRSLKDKGCKVDVVGSQSHLELNSPLGENGSEIDTTIKEFAAIGVKTAFTELDIDVISRKPFWNAQTKEATKTTDPYKAGCPAEVLAQQAEVYKTFFDAVMRNKKHVDRVTLWGLTDGDSWLNSWPWKRTNHGLLFDRQCVSKPAHKAIMEVLRKHS